MDNQAQESTQDLLNCFFAECQSEFRFLERKFGYTAISGLVEYKNGRQMIRPYYSQNIDGLFRACARYEKDDHALEILYGDANLAVEGYVTYNHIFRLQLHEIMNAAKKDEDAIGGGWLVTQRSMIRDTVGAMAKSFNSHKDIFLEPDPRLVERAVVMRGRRMEQALRQQLQKSLDQAIMMAARAFTDKHYRRVIELLSPYEIYLADADLKKLKMARKNILNPA